MAYEFIATGLKPAQPVKSFLDTYTQGKEFQQNQEINKVNIEAGQKRNEMADVQLKDAQTQIAAEKAAGQLPRGEDGSLDIKSPEFGEFLKQYPKQGDTYRKNAFAEDANKFTSLKSKLDLVSVLSKNIHSPEQMEELKTHLNQWGLGDVSPEIFGDISVSATELGQKIEARVKDYKNLIAAGKYDEAELLKSEITAESQKTAAEIRLKNAQLSLVRAKEKSLQTLTGTMGKPAKDYRWREDGSQEPIPGGPADIKMKKDAQIESSALESMTSVIDAEIRNIDKLIGSDDGKVKKHPGLDAMLGSIDSRLPSVLSDTRNAEALLESLQSKASISALRDVRSGGSQSIGQITEREWPRLENMKATLQIYQDEEQFIKNLKEYRDELIKTKRHGKSAYDDFTRSVAEPVNSSKDLSNHSTDELMKILLGQSPETE